MSDWSREDVSTLTGVGPKLREKLQRLGIQNKRQMLFHLPLRYEDRTRIIPLGSIQSGQRVLFEAEVLQAAVSFRRGGRSRRVLIVKLSDNTGFITLRFFHFSSAQQQRLEKGAWVRGFGEARLVMGGLEMIHPEYEVFDPQSPPALDEFLTPIYPTTEGLHQLSLRKIMRQLIEQLKAQGMAETMPRQWLEQHNFPSVSEALLALHNPHDQQDVQLIQRRKHPAQHRFIVEELTAHRISLL